jgi:hypothetical protein
MYTGRVDRVCCLCGDRETRTSIGVPPRATTLMEDGDPIAWRDIDGAVTLYFCDSDWAVVRDLALEAGMHPIGRCNAARAEFSLRADYEAYLNAVREPIDQAALEARLREEAAAVAADAECRDRVEARVVLLALEELGSLSPEGVSGSN